jgi:hypothetical protein
MSLCSSYRLSGWASRSLGRPYNMGGALYYPWGRHVLATNKKGPTWRSEGLLRPLGSPEGPSGFCWLRGLFCFGLHGASRRPKDGTGPAQTWGWAKRPLSRGLTPGLQVGRCMSKTCRLARFMGPRVSMCRIGASLCHKGSSGLVRDLRCTAKPGHKHTLGALRGP